MVDQKGTPVWNGVDKRRENQRKGERRKGMMERKKHAVFSDLKKKLLIYFLLIVFVSISISLELIWEVGEVKLANKIKDGFIAQANDKATDEAVMGFDYEAVLDPLRHLQKRMLIILGIVLFCIGVTLYFFIKDVVGPLDDMVNTAKEISKGNLAKTVPVYSKDEIGQLGSIINDITADFQEVLLMVGKISLTASDATDIIHNRVEVLNEKKISREIQDQLNVLYKNIDELKSLVGSFKFYQIDLDKL